ncbi:hypothetical protein K440DRAFT_620469 [Wilcoxina mikolae CBS 423.85]|nr:hypothetical protein K440DRAFT_620469 [Wilcoxina mikolae CBS 423.85]
MPGINAGANPLYRRISPQYAILARSMIPTWYCQSPPHSSPMSVSLILPHTISPISNSSQNTFLSVTTPFLSTATPSERSCCFRASLSSLNGSLYPEG